MKTIKLIFLALFFLSVTAFAQETTIKRKVGLTTSVQQGDYGIQLPIWLSNTITLAPSVSVKSVEDGGSDFVFGLIPHFYLKQTRLSPYIGFKLGIAMFDAKEENIYGDATNPIDVLTGFAFGGEYFFDPQFSIGVEAQANLTISDDNSNRFGNPGGMNFNTGMAVNASVYFGK